MTQWETLFDRLRGVPAIELLAPVTWAERADIPVDRENLVREGWWWELVTEAKFNKIMKEKGVIK